VPSCECPDCQLPADGPPLWLRDKATPIWCGSFFDQRADELGGEAAGNCAAGFAWGFEKGLVMAMLRPEWAQGFYHELRDYYLTTHSLEDLEDWEEAAEATGRAIVIDRPAWPKDR